MARTEVHEAARSLPFIPHFPKCLNRGESEDNAQSHTSDEELRKSPEHHPECENIEEPDSRRTKKVTNKTCVTADPVERVSVDR